MEKIIDKIVDFIAAIIHGSEDRVAHKSGVKYALQDLDRLLRSQNYISVKNNIDNDLPCQCCV
jgi:hypothetical protein